MGGERSPSVLGSGSRADGRGERHPELINDGLENCTPGSPEGTASAAAPRSRPVAPWANPPPALNRNGRRHYSSSRAPPHGEAACSAWAPLVCTAPTDLEISAFYPCPLLGATSPMQATRLCYAYLETLVGIK